MSIKIFYTCFTFLVIGVAFSTSTLRSYSESIFLILLALGCFILLRNKGAAHILISCALVSCSLGIARGVYESKRVYAFSEHVGTYVTRQGTVTQESDIGAYASSVIVRDNETKELLIVRVSGVHRAYPGDRVQYTGTVAVPESFDTDGGRRFLYQKFLLARGIAHVIDDANVEHVNDTQNGYQTLKALVLVKEKLISVVTRYVPEPEAGLASAMFLGTKRTIDESEIRVFKDVGIIHVVVLSGMHITFVFGVFHYMFSYIAGRRIRAIVALFGTFLFALMVGLTPTVTRAVTMILFIAVSAVLSRSASPLRSLCIAGAGMVFIHPYILLFDPGFYLSFVATLALILVFPIFHTMFRAVPEVFMMREICAATVSIELLLLPILVFTTGTVSVVGLIANILVLPVVPFATGSSTLLALCALIDTHIALSLAPIVVKVHAYILSVAHTLHALPFATILVAPFPVWVLIISYVLIGCVICVLYIRYVYLPQPMDDVLRSSEDVRAYRIVALDEYIQSPIYEHGK